ncbi:FeoA family protein [Desulfocurvibacter africanus]|uniref:FeoA family protein n=1 Tax=Desulfocurvibacter africanus subsp. africanus str. Walvis Bay TaxID=690850 RepID=F3YWB4_DESAF|nr:FeoA family protein [Desulfocurvibacter africanus]EGJ49217.1 FeoA family protein [Desulfocurvibacter africanus subsp. africanus str. Walvis Bay]
MTQAQPLTSFAAGSRVKVVNFDSCNHARCRLCALGLTPGVMLEIDSGGPGPLRIRVRGSSLVLGQGLASQVLASRVE